MCHVHFCRNLHSSSPVGELQHLKADRCSSFILPFLWSSWNFNTYSKHLWISIYFDVFWCASDIFLNSQCQGQRIGRLESFRLSVGTFLIRFDQVKALFFHFVYDNVFPPGCVLVYQLRPKGQPGSRFLGARCTVYCP